MAITSVGTAGVVGHSTSTSSWSTALDVGSLAANDWIVFLVAADNITTTDGDSNDHTLTGESLTWVKLGEQTNGNGSAAAGVTLSLWMARNTTGSTIGTFDFTVTFASAVVDKCATAWKFGAGSTLAYVTGSRQYNTTDGSTGYGSVSISGLPSIERLYFRALAKEANASSQITVSTNFTALTTVRSRNHADAVLARGEFRINTSTGETSNPTHAVSGDTVGIFVAISEGEPAAANDCIVVTFD